jgi:hypothetical protein
LTSLKENPWAVDRGRVPMNALHASSSIKVAKIGRAEVRKSG